jgi:nicotinate-nucleotide adenylyltransferase
MKPVGILGGTFDPVHHGHLRLALEAHESLRLESVRLIPLRLPPHRDPPVASSAQRLAMLHAAVSGEPALRVDDRELRRDAVSYTVDTLLSLRAELGEEIPLCLLLGMDAFRALDTWHRWQGLIELAHLVVASRPDAVLPETGPVHELLGERHTHNLNDLHRKPAGYVFRQPIPPLDISASHIRALIAAGRNPRYLLPEGAIAIINQHRLYRGHQQHAA